MKAIRLSSVRFLPVQDSGCQMTFEQGKNTLSRGPTHPKMFCHPWAGRRIIQTYQSNIPSEELVYELVEQTMRVALRRRRDVRPKPRAVEHHWNCAQNLGMSIISEEIRLSSLGIIYSCVSPFIPSHSFVMQVFTERRVTKYEGRGIL